MKIVSTLFVIFTMPLCSQSYFKYTAWDNFTVKQNSLKSIDGKIAIESSKGLGWQSQWNDECGANINRQTKTGIRAVFSVVTDIEEDFASGVILSGIAFSKISLPCHDGGIRKTFILNGKKAYLIQPQKCSQLDSAIVIKKYMKFLIVAQVFDIKENIAEFCSKSELASLFAQIETHLSTSKYVNRLEFPVIPDNVGEGLLNKSLDVCTKVLGSSECERIRTDENITPQKFFELYFKKIPCEIEGVLTGNSDLGLYLNNHLFLEFDNLRLGFWLFALRERLNEQDKPIGRLSSEYAASLQRKGFAPGALVPPVGKVIPKFSH